MMVADGVMGTNVLLGTATSPAVAVREIGVGVGGCSRSVPLTINQMTMIAAITTSVVIQVTLGCRCLFFDVFFMLGDKSFCKPDTPNCTASVVKFGHESMLTLPERLISDSTWAFPI